MRRQLLYKGKGEKTLHKSYEQYKSAILSDGRLIRVQNRLNLKQPMTSNVYRETPVGWREYTGLYNDSVGFLETNGVVKHSTQKQYIERLIGDITITEELNDKAEHLIATPSGEILDIKALCKIKTEGRDPEKYANEWRKPPSAYSDNRITLCTGVNYNPNIHQSVGQDIIKELVRLMTNPPDKTFLENTYQWLIGFMGRLLIGGNMWKEAVVFLGEKNSGKTTIVNILKEILGSYCGVVKDEILYGNDTDSISRHLYILKDKRLLIHSEGLSRNKVNTATLKRITGDSFIPLGNQDYSFTIKGKIVEDTNYAPIPDNPKDEAFNDRVIIIPFQRNTIMSKKTIDGIITLAKENKEAIFVAMVHAAAINMQGALPQTRPLVAENVKNILHVLRNLEKYFYTTICESSNLPDNISTYGRVLHERFQDWIMRCIIPGLKQCPYLASEETEFSSASEFHAKMKKLHPSYDHGREGLRYKRLFVHMDRIYLDPKYIVYSENNPSLYLKRAAARAAEQERKMVESLDTKVSLNHALDDSISKDNKRVKGIREPARISAGPFFMGPDSFFTSPCNMFPQTNPSFYSRGPNTVPFPIESPGRIQRKKPPIDLAPNPNSTPIGDEMKPVLEPEPLQTLKVLSEEEYSKRIEELENDLNCYTTPYDCENVRGDMVRMKVCFTPYDISVIE
jgi:energy-coupling factor transporter ATP-binding protein EcfA2